MSYPTPVYVCHPIHKSSAVCEALPELSDWLMKYLIVDDHPRTRRSVRESLWQPGDTFQESSTGEEAVELYKRMLPDWVIMDVRMPGVGGLVAASRITTEHAEAKILVLSQFDDPDVAEAARRAGALAFLNKENIADLTDVLTRLTNQLSADGASEKGQPNP